MPYYTCHDTNYAIQFCKTFSSSTILQPKNNVLFILLFYCLIKSGLVDTDGKWTADG